MELAQHCEGATGSILVSESTMEWTAVFQKVADGYIGFVQELPGANTQGSTLDETRENLKEAIELILDANRAASDLDLEGMDVVREPLVLSREE